MLRGAFVLALALTSTLLGYGLPVHAAQEAEPPIVARVAGITPFVDATHPLGVVVQVFNGSDEVVEETVLRVTLYPPVLSRSQLRQELEEGFTRSPLQTLTQVRTQPLPPGSRGVFRITRPAPELPSLTGTGVYPIAIAISADEHQVIHRTAIPHLATVPETRLNLSWLVPVGRATAVRANGAFLQTVIEDMGLRQLAEQMRAVAARPGMPVTMIPEGSFVDELVALSDGFRLDPLDGEPRDVGADHPFATEAAEALDALRAAARVVGEVASTAYTPADLAALSSHGLVGDVVRQIGAGRRAIEQHLNRTPSFRFLAPPGFRVGPQEASTLTTLGVEGVVVDPAVVPEVQTPNAHPSLRYDLFGVSRPVLVRTGGERLGALVIDPDLRAHLQGDDQGALRIQAVIAETASSWLEAPGLAGDRLLVLAASSIPEASSVGALLDGLAAAPWLQMRTASDALTVLRPGAPAVEPEGTSPRDAPNLARARRARANLELLDAISIEPHPRSEELENLVLLAESGEWEADPQIGAALAGVAVLTVDEIVAGIDVVPRVVTLTSRRGALPVTLTNAANVPVRVRVRLESTKATFPQGESRTVDLRSQQKTEDFEVEALAAGSFPIRVVVESLDGRVLASRSVVLRSTAVSAVALIAVGGGALVLILGSVRRGRKRRNGRTQTG